MRRVAPRSHLGCPEDCVNSSLNLRIVYRRIDELKPDPANPRRHAKKQVRQIAESIRTFGFVAPILIDRDGNVIAGHGRLAACRTLGITEVPTLCLDHLTPTQARAFMIADNRLAEIAIWDDRLLAEQLKELSLAREFNVSQSPIREALRELEGTGLVTSAIGSSRSVSVSQNRHHAEPVSESAKAAGWVPR